MPLDCEVTSGDLSAASHGSVSETFESNLDPGMRNLLPDYD